MAAPLPSRHLAAWDAYKARCVGEYAVACERACELKELRRDTEYDIECMRYHLARRRHDAALHDSAVEACGHVPEMCDAQAYAPDATRFLRARDRHASMGACLEAELAAHLVHLRQITVMCELAMAKKATIEAHGLTGDDDPDAPVPERFRVGMCVVHLGRSAVVDAVGHGVLKLTFGDDTTDEVDPHACKATAPAWYDRVVVVGGPSVGREGTYYGTLGDTHGKVALTGAKELCELRVDHLCKTIATA